MFSTNAPLRAPTLRAMQKLLKSQFETTSGSIRNKKNTDKSEIRTHASFETTRSVQGEDLNVAP